MRRHRSVLTQMLVVSSVSAVLIGAAEVANYLAAASQTAGADQVASRYVLLQQEEGAMQTAFSNAVTETAFSVATGQRAYNLILGASEKTFDANLAALRRQATPELRPLIEAQGRVGSEWFALAPNMASVRPGSRSARLLFAQSNQLSGVFLVALTSALNVLNGDIERQTSGSKNALRIGLVWSSAALGAAVLLVLVLSLSMLFTVTRPLRAIAATVRRLTEGDHAARAELTGTAEVREVAQSVNYQADEAQRLRAEEGRLRAREAESNRVRAAAREAGLRIREPLAEADVLRQARDALEQIVAADRVLVLLLGEDGLLITIAGTEPEPWWQAGGLRWSGDLTEWLQRLLRGQRSSVVQDARAEPGEVPPQWREMLPALGVRSLIAAPFGVGAELLGLCLLGRMAEGHPWSAAEVDAVESIVADLGRGLRHARLYEAEGRLVEKLQAVDAAKSDFFATVSHELRSPLTTIEGYLEMMADDQEYPLPGRQRSMVEIVQRSAGRLHTLIEDVFTLARLESGAFTAEACPVEVAAVVGGAVEAILPSAAGKRVGVAAARVDASLVVQGDPGQLERVMINLLSNAVKYTPAGGAVTVSATAANASAVIAVSDTGIGIPEAEQPRLFSRFFRASNVVSGDIPGTGLGLAIVHTIVANHNGTISVQSREGAGTTFTIELPRRTTPADS
jgi:two-component system, OmpR family, phosphate regulon sensor histidine kinase PhoR